jgi:hypothetical protein
MTIERHPADVDAVYLRLPGVVIATDADGRQCLVSDGRAWLYDDPRAVALYDLCGQNLARIDDWLLGLDDAARQTAMQARGRLLRLVAAGRAAEAMNLALRFVALIEGNAPAMRLLRQQLGQRQQRAETMTALARRPRGGATAEWPERRKKAVVAEYDALVRADGKRGARQTVADRHGITPRQLDALRKENFSP